MRWRNGEHGYGIVTKVLHWATVALLAAQFAVGYLMDDDGGGGRADGVSAVDCDPPGEDRSGGDTTDAEEERLDQLEESCEQAQDLREQDADDAVASAWSDLWSGGGVDGVDGVDGADGAASQLALPGWHVLLGLAIIAVGVLRLVWRRTTPLPPWDPRLTGTDRKIMHWAERILLAMLFVVPATGIALVVGSTDLLPLHIAAHLCFFAALAAHVGVVVRRRVIGRMLWSPPR
ncbi:cytochrome b [Promicromonospora kroppenstedtii]|uniref:cytochrome b n=1 Tax=Promicromonospora kroppenstedtii TaxID=440482 RepID=UPI0004B2D486|nr:cytochrome b/b6 domain-containing protein [Promicromonospora kroppenstedtii]